METKRASWASNLGFLMAAIGSAVGLGNIWGFPYKMGKSGGFAYLAVYALLAIFVGFIVMASELAMGRKTGQGAMGTYHALTKKFRWIGWLALFSPFAVMGFYAVLGGYCIEYMALNLSNFAFGSESLATGGELFAAMLSNPAGAVLFAAGVFYYFTTEEVKSLATGVAKRFPRGRLVFDAAGKTAVRLMLKTWVKQAGIRDVGAYFSVKDAKRELEPWSPLFSVSSRGYMLGYQSLHDPAVRPVHRLLAKLADGPMHLQIVRIDFAE